MAALPTELGVRPGPALPVGGSRKSSTFNTEDPPTPTGNSRDIPNYQSQTSKDRDSSPKPPAVQAASSRPLPPQRIERHGTYLNVPTPCPFCSPSTPPMPSIHISPPQQDDISDRPAFTQPAPPFSSASPRPEPAAAAASSPPRKPSWKSRITFYLAFAKDEEKRGTYGGRGRQVGCGTFFRSLHML
ncbi:hypothetical protein PRK78_001122 [Emydomyces testavorans]|uniref:Uncharacterized protein n=1 Tax=Emydomyces testavorans TaxID=2070801 RepID=A0AAF0DC09_9EURO|nr:hypothetical protein PRK78_001122 [Emydomyces testavorans]